ncbi:MAG: glycine/betaine/sarcosine/D-proline family reductase selenoprotein B [Candidatus Tectomicrobia bacterium]|uniref:Glycine/betaine/sarcosine/D-proline family reductase selenoprotein B n=1 Tax=Tectimicrobiota bacterium TaxID=2528274 RepID=A0A937W017_UNCTE|nr:glycine/betaine/sarcosine/D-proline family reductase selenoprotein B [Candidatus Tectomicrobia bacterium]
MPDMVRIVHYLNAFFGGVGGEAEAQTPVSVHAGALGPGRLLEHALAGQGQVAATLMCGDGYWAEHEETVVQQVREHLQQLKPDVFLAGPAFRSGRYGLACGRLCLEAERLGIPAVTGMHVENPGSDLYRSEHVYIVATEASAVGMRPALERMVALAIKRARHEPLGTAAEEGFLPRAVRRTVPTGIPAAQRAVDMALRKWRGEPYTSEIAVETFEAVPPAPAVSNPAQMWLALVTESGLVRKGNPDRLPSAAATHWAAYTIAGMERLVAGEWDAVHGGYDNTAALQDPNRVVPLDALRALEREGVIGKLDDTLFVTVGNIGSLNAMKRIGAEIAARLVQRGVQAVVLPAT